MHFRRPGYHGRRATEERAAGDNQAGIRQAVHATSTGLYLIVILEPRIFMRPENLLFRREGNKRKRTGNLSRCHVNLGRPDLWENRGNDDEII